MIQVAAKHKICPQYLPFSLQPTLLQYWTVSTSTVKHIYKRECLFLAFRMLWALWNKKKILSIFPFTQQAGRQLVNLLKPIAFVYTKIPGNWTKLSTICNIKLFVFLLWICLFFLLLGQKLTEHWLAWNSALWPTIYRCYVIVHNHNASMIIPI